MIFFKFDFWRGSPPFFQAWGFVSMHDDLLSLSIDDEIVENLFSYCSVNEILVIFLDWKSQWLLGFTPKILDSEFINRPLVVPKNLLGLKFSSRILSLSVGFFLTPFESFHLIPDFFLFNNISQKSDPRLENQNPNFTFKGKTESF